MATSRDIIRGTFRLSIVVAVVAAAYSAYQDWQAGVDAYQKTSDMVMTYECGARKNVDSMSPETLRHISNEAGLIDLSKVGCAIEQFSASLEEISQAREGTMRRHYLSDGPAFDKRATATSALVYAFMWFVAVNLLGLAFLAVRSVFRWIADGFNARAS